MSEQDRLIEHEYDGIKEFDNPMPTWWVACFWISIIFAVVYLMNFAGIGVGEGRIAAYEADMAAWRAEHPIEAPTASSDELMAIAQDPARIEAGGTVFATNCAACHAADGGGGIGPNLADDFFLHGGTIVDAYRVIDLGVLDKGMPQWGRTLSPDDVQSVTVYVWSLIGSSPAAPKDAQGDPVSP